jgi:hypothetical protein
MVSISITSSVRSMAGAVGQRVFRDGTAARAASSCDSPWAAGGTWRAARRRTARATPSRRRSADAASPESPANGSGEVILGRGGSGREHVETDDRSWSAASRVYHSTKRLPAARLAGLRARRPRRSNVTKFLRVARVEMVRDLERRIDRRPPNNFNIT